MLTVVLSGWALHFGVLFSPRAVSMYCPSSRAVVVALVQLKHVTGLVVAAWLLHRRFGDFGGGLPQSRNFLLDVVRNAWLAYFQWPAAESAAPAAVCSWSSASNLHPEPEDVLVVAPSRPAANTKCFAVCCSQCLAYLLPMASG